MRMSHMYMLNISTSKVKLMKLVMVSCVHSKYLSLNLKQDLNDQFNEVAAYFMSWLIPSAVIFSLILRNQVFWLK